MATKKKAISRKTATRKAPASKSMKKKTKAVSGSSKTGKKSAAARKASSRKTAAGGKTAVTKKKASASTKKKKTPAKKTPVRSKTSQSKTASPKASSRKTARKPAPPRREPPKRRLSTFADAVNIYEAAVRLMHGEKYDQARAEFARMIAEYPKETELVDRARVLIQVCDKRLNDLEAKPRFKDGNDYYEVGVAEMNSGALDEAEEHLGQAAKLLPDADHVLYALGALWALRGQNEKALDYLSRSITARNENRFQAANDADFASLAEDPEFVRLLASRGGPKSS